MENPQEDLILEIIHQFIANLVHTFDIKNNYLDEDDPWSGVTAATAFATQIMYDTTLQAMAGQLVFGCDMILNIPFVADWEYIRLCKQKIIDINNKLQRKNFKPHTYRIQDKVFVRNKNSYKYEEL